MQPQGKKEQQRQQVERGVVNLGIIVIYAAPLNHYIYIRPPRDGHNPFNLQNNLNNGLLIFILQFMTVAASQF
jgi:hypothetical protein